MRISFIGMSNIGKTTWGRRVADALGVERIDCDTLIEKRLGDEFAEAGYHGLRDVAKWMGQPPEPQYEENSRRYMACERAVVHESVVRLRKDDKFPVVVDTTGSVIYTDADILAELRAVTRVIYLEASEAHTDELFRRYIAHPKPTIWGDIYAPLPDETVLETRKRCYPQLLRERARRYSAIAHVTIPYEKHRNKAADISALLNDAIVS